MKEYNFFNFLLGNHKFKEKEILKGENSVYFTLFSYGMFGRKTGITISDFDLAVYNTICNLYWQKKKRSPDRKVIIDTLDIYNQLTLSKKIKTESVADIFDEIIDNVNKFIDMSLKIENTIYGECFHTTLLGELTYYEKDVSFGELDENSMQYVFESEPYMFCLAEKNG